LLVEIRELGIKVVKVTLHIGLDTFAPVTEEAPDEHQIHQEWCQVSNEAADSINEARSKGGRVIAVGTTSVRSLETAVQGEPTKDRISPYQGNTSLYILPGYTFRAVDSIITNFHLPHSTLLMMISAFTGRDQLLSLYDEAIRRNYRFYSFGDAMLIL
jgi:S-adenosylmethionine:tRNA ribosyltransferase-isomerase